MFFKQRHKWKQLSSSLLIILEASEHYTLHKAFDLRKCRSFFLQTDSKQWNPSSLSMRKNPKFIVRIHKVWYFRPPCPNEAPSQCQQHVKVLNIVKNQLSLSHGISFP